MITSKNRNKSGRLARAFSIVLLIILYCICTCRIDSVHELFDHHAESTLHTPDQESAPCHISIYHQERSGGCEHDTHVSENDRCSLCDSQVHNAHICLAVGVQVIHFSVDSDFISTEHCPSKGFISYSPSRAPPRA